MRRRRRGFMDGMFSSDEFRPGLRPHPAFFTTRRRWGLEWNNAFYRSLKREVARAAIVGSATPRLAAFIARPVRGDRAFARRPADSRPDGRPIYRPAAWRNVFERQSAPALPPCPLSRRVRVSAHLTLASLPSKRTQHRS